MKSLLTFDIGNSRPHVGHFEQGQLVDVYSLGHFEENFHKSLGGLDFTTSIVGKKAEILASLTGREINLRSHWNGPQFFGMPIKYAQTLGDDRLFESACAWQEIKAQNIESALVIDIGTFITFDWIHIDRGHLGGIIAPGTATYLNNFARGEQLQIFKPDEINWSGDLGLPLDTKSAILTGAKWYLEGLLEKALEVPEGKRKIILTGGGAAVAQTILERLQVGKIELRPHFIHEAMFKLASLTQN